MIEDLKANISEAIQAEELQRVFQNVPMCPTLPTNERVALSAFALNLLQLFNIYQNQISCFLLCVFVVFNNKYFSLKDFFFYYTRGVKSLLHCFSCITLHYVCLPKIMHDQSFWYICHIICMILWPN